MALNPLVSLFGRLVGTGQTGRTDGRTEGMTDKYCNTRCACAPRVTWRLIKSFYEKPTCRVRVNGKLSEQFVLQREVRQGSVLSPILFLILMDSLLAQANRGISIKGVYTGSFGHADDVRSVAADLMSIKKQDDRWKGLLHAAHPDRY